MKINNTFAETTEERRCERLRNLLMPMWTLTDMVLNDDDVHNSIKDVAQMADDNKEMILTALDITTDHRELGQLHNNEASKDPIREKDEIDELIDEISGVYRTLVIDLRNKQYELLNKQK